MIGDVLLALLFIGCVSRLAAWENERYARKQDAKERKRDERARATRPPVMFRVTATGPKFK